MIEPGRKKDSMKAQLLFQDRLASIGLLAAGLAHEMGTPLGTIRGRAEMLLASAQQERGESADSLQIILSQVDRVSELLKTLVQFCATANRDEFSVVSMKAAGDKVVRLVGRECEEYQITIRCEIPEEAQVLGTLPHLEQILVNLVVNSIQAMEGMPSGADKEIVLGAGKFEGEWVLRVTDSGPGIPEDIRTEIFRAFYTTKEVGSGAGLGLTISAKLVDELGGRIHVAESGCDGTSFDLYFPVYKNQ